jgi:hypothetical protein
LTGLPWEALSALPRLGLLALDGNA